MEKNDFIKKIENCQKLDIEYCDSINWISIYGKKLSISIDLNELLSNDFDLIFKLLNQLKEF